MKNIVFLLIGIGTILFKDTSAKSHLNPLNKNKASKIYIKVFFKEAKKSDTLEIHLVNPFYRVQVNSVKYRASPDAKGVYTFDIPVSDSIGSFFVSKLLHINDKYYNQVSAFNYIPISPVFYWEKNDSINIAIKKKVSPYKGDNSPLNLYTYSFSGRGSAKYTVLYRIDSALEITQNKNLPIFDPYFGYHNRAKQSKEAAFKILQAYRNILPLEYYYIFKADILAYGSQAAFVSITDYFRVLSDTSSESAIRRFRKIYRHSSLSQFQLTDIPAKYLVESHSYCFSLLQKIQAYYYVFHLSDNPDSVYYLIKNSFEGKLRDYLLTKFLYSARFNHLNQVLGDAFATIKTPVCFNNLAELKQRLSGEKALNFSFSNLQGQKVNLKDFKGKIVLMDFWFNGCGGCAAYYHDVLSKAELYYRNAPNVKFLSVNVDRQKSFWLKGIKSGLFTSDDACNLFTNGNGALDPIVRYYNIQEYPTAILLKPNGLVFKYNSSELYNYESLRRLIDILKRELKKGGGQ